MAIFKLLSISLVGILILSCGGKKTLTGSQLIPTTYYLPIIHVKNGSCTAASMRDLVSVDGSVFTSLCDSDFMKCFIQGTCFVSDGQKVASYNYHSMIDGIPRFTMVDLKVCPFGYGVNNICLDPFFSVAADLKIYKVGDVIFVPRLVGAVLPSGEIHNGFLIIRDSGGGIRGPRRFDFFTGVSDYRDKDNVFSLLGFSDPKNRFEFRLATEAETKLVHGDRNYPGFKK